MLGDCWLWGAQLQRAGYGVFTIRKGLQVGAHRVSYALTYGPIPERGVICHRCDNPPCVNPAHLFLGTPVDNALDMVAKGRGTWSRGVDRANARLTEEDVRQIRASEQYHGLIQDLATHFSVSTTTIRSIRNGNRWRHVA